MRTIKLVVAYDGANYHGFQKQNHKNEVVDTVQAILEDMLCKFCGETVYTVGSGRTDAGVHALAQTISFTTNGRIPCENIVRASRSLLPDDIVVLHAEEVPEGFHARHSACWKQYQYRISCSTFADPFKVRYAWQMNESLCVEDMQAAADLLIGTHDFSAFRSTGSVESSPIKTIYAATWTQQENDLLFCITGDGFLYHMVRNLVWSLVQVGFGKRTVDDFAAELAAKRGDFLNEPAPAQGLYLAKVGYEPYQGE